MKKPSTESLVVGAFVATLILLIGVTAWASFQIKDLRNIIAEIKLVQPKDGSNGVDGKKGEDGVTTHITEVMPGKAGTNGNNGKSVTQEQIQSAVDTYLHANPVKGEKGDTGQPGVPGRTITQRTNEITGEVECKFFGSTVWLSGDDCS